MPVFLYEIALIPVSNFLQNFLGKNMSDAFTWIQVTDEVAYDLFKPLVLEPSRDSYRRPLRWSQRR